MRAAAERASLRRLLCAKVASNGNLELGSLMRRNTSYNEVLRVFREHPSKEFRLKELADALGLRPNEVGKLRGVLNALAHSRRIVRTKDNGFRVADPSGTATKGSRRQPTRPVHRPAERHVRERKPQQGHSPSANRVSGRLVGHRDGYGFVVTDRPIAGTDQDVFIPRNAMGPAMHGDRVEVQVTRLRPDHRPRSGGIRETSKLRVEGRIMGVLEHAQKTVVGEFRAGPRQNTVLPFDLRIPFEIVIPRGAERPPEAVSESRNRQFGGESEGRQKRGHAAAQASAQDLDHMVVDVEITNFPAPGAPPRGRVIEVLGQRDDFGVDVEIVIRKFHLPHRFAPEVLVEASNGPQFLSSHDRAARRDFRPLPIVTIDGETAKDFDDAVYVERLAGGNYLLQVHIADVAHYVRPGTPLDREARLRGTSVYFPDRAVPMLPLDLSNGICSLNPHVERLVMSALMEIDGHGRILRHELVPGVIRSAERMTYRAVRDILAGEPAACARYGRLVEQFKLMEELARILTRHREERGSIDFDLPEPEIEFDEQGRMVGVTRSERNIAHRIIEEFMLAANETVAGYLEQAGVPALFRVHEKPDPKKVLEFEEIAATFGYSLGIKLPSVRRERVRGRDERERHPRFHEEIEKVELEITPRHYQRLTQRLEGKPVERILSYLMLRSLRQARYAAENLGHFALAAETYTHFTSPIRRYPDLIVHRILKSVLERKGGGARVDASPERVARSHGKQPPPPVSPEELQALALETSEAERRAQDAERELIELKKVAFMAQHLGDEFDALVVSLIRQGMFVELVDLFVEGFVPIETLGKGDYVYRESQRAMTGRSGGKAYRLGDRVRARLDRLDRSGNRLQFCITDSTA
jgi:ribonuclease R